MSTPARRIVHEENIKPFKTPHQKQQRLMAVILGSAVAGLAVGAYFLLMPHQDVYRLRGYETALVTRSNLVYSTQAGGVVAFPVQLTLPSPEEGIAAQLYVQEGDVQNS